MGLTIMCKGSSVSYSLGYGGFMRLRRKVAELCCPEIVPLYEECLKSPLCRKISDEEVDEKLDKLIRQRKISSKIVDFLYACDCDGHIGYGTCRLVYEKVKNYDDNCEYGYAVPGTFKFNDFKSVLLECIENKSNLLWY